MKSTNGSLRKLLSNNTLALIILCSFLCFINLNLHAQSDSKVKLAIGAAFNHSPSFTYNSNTGSGNLISVFGDLTIKQKIIGRAQFSSMLASSFKRDGKDWLEGGFATNGSLGYIIKLGGDSKLEIPIMATLGYVLIFYDVFSDTYHDASMQIGGTISPQYFINDRLALNATGRYLKGTGVNGGASINILDLSVGVKFVLLR